MSFCYQQNGICYYPLGGRLPDGAEPAAGPFSPLVFLVERDPLATRGIYAAHTPAEVLEPEGPSLLLPAAEGALDAAADATVILTWWKLQDALRDGKLAQRMGSRAAALPLRGHYRAAAARWPAFDETVRSCLEELHQLERDRVPSLDRPADTFARILQAAAVETDLAARTRGVQQILYHVGRWIYLADAWDDLAEDQRTGNYSPLLARFGDQAAASKESLRETMRVSLGLANTAFSLLDWGEWEPLLGHILGTGLPAVEEAVFTGQWKQRKRPFHHHQGSAPAAVPTNKEKETYE